MDKLTAELAAAAWFESVRIPVMSASELTEERQFGPGSVILTTVLNGVVRRLNPDLPHDTIEEVVRILSRPPHPTLIQNNRWFHTLVTDGVEVEYREAESGDGPAAAVPEWSISTTRPRTIYWYCASTASPERRARSSART